MSPLALTPGSTFHVISDCGHLPPIEKPGILAALLQQLLDRRSESPIASVDIDFRAEA
jgi:hypothetical protein